RRRQESGRPGRRHRHRPRAPGVPLCRRRQLSVDRAAAGRADTDEQGLQDRDGLTVRASGEAMTSVQVNSQTEKDLLRMESIAIPLSFVVLVWVFGGLMAAALP